VVKSGKCMGVSKLWGRARAAPQSLRLRRAAYCRFLSIHHFDPAQFVCPGTYWAKYWPNSVQDL